MIAGAHVAESHGAVQMTIARRDRHRRRRRGAERRRRSWPRAARASRARGEGRARRARDGVHRSADRRAGRQRPARAARLLRRDVRVPAADRHRGSRARAAEPRGRLRRSRRASEAGCACPVCRRRSIFAAGLLDWEALGWRDRLAALQARRADTHRAGRAEGREQRADAHAHCGVAGRDGRGVAHPQRPDGAHPRDAVGAARARGAESVVREAAAPPFAAVLAQMFGGGPRDAALALPTCPLDELYAEPARRFIEAAAGRCASAAPPAIHLDGGRVGSRRSARRAPGRRRGRCRRALVRARRPVRRRHRAASKRLRKRRPRPRAVADREREPVARSPDSADAVSRPARPVDAVGVRQGADVRDGARRI